MPVSGRQAIPAANSIWHAAWIEGLAIRKDEYSLLRFIRVVVGWHFTRAWYVGL